MFLFQQISGLKGQNKSPRAADATGGKNAGGKAAETSPGGRSEASTAASPAGGSTPGSSQAAASSSLRGPVNASSLYNAYPPLAARYAAQPLVVAQAAAAAAGDKGEAALPDAKSLDRLGGDGVGEEGASGDAGMTSEESFPLTASNLVNMALLSSRHQKVSVDDFKLLKVIGKGSYGKVMLVERKTDRQVFAMKMLRKENIVRRNQVQHTKTERHVLQSINHPFIVQLYSAFQTPQKLYFVMEYCPGGELFYHLSRAGRFMEQTAQFYSAQLVLALEHLHKLDVIYRDLKPENVLLDKDGYVRLTDFGLSKEGIQDNYSARSLCGTPEYLAPEILNQSGHGKAVDWWSLGALVYEMLSGLPPFYTRDREKLFQSIRYGELKYRSFISPTAKSLMMSLLDRNPDRRLGAGPHDAKEIKAHPFFASVNWTLLLEKRITPPFRPHLVSETDVSYFDKDFIKLPIVDSEVPDAALDGELDQFEGFTYDPRAEHGIAAAAAGARGT